MRTFTYLNEIADLHSADRESLRVADRHLADDGLRRKGRGRAIPSPTIREEITLHIAAGLLGFKGAGTNDIACATATWLNLPSNSKANGFGPDVPATLGDALIDLCCYATRRNTSLDGVVELNLTERVAVVDYDRADRKYLDFGIRPEIEPVYRSARILRIEARLFSMIATSHFDELLG